MMDPNALILLDHAKFWWNVVDQRHLHDQSNKAHINATVENPKRSLDCRQKMCIWSSQGWLVTTSSKTTWWLYSKLSSCKSSWKRLFNTGRIVIPSPQTDHALWYWLDKNSNSWPTWNKSLNDSPSKAQHRAWASTWGQPQKWEPLQLPAWQSSMQ